MSTSVPASSPRVYKVAMIGDGNVGKTTFTKRHKTGEFQRDHKPTMGVEIRPLLFETNYGTIVFNVWDVAGREEFVGLGGGYYLGADAAIAMFSLTDKASYKNVRQWCREYRKVRPRTPIVLCGNKADCSPRLVPMRKITYHRKRGYSYYDISARCNYNFEKPFLSLARQLTGHSDLVFTDHPCEEELDSAGSASGSSSSESDSE